MAVCFSESVGELFLTDFAVASSVGKQKIKTRGGGGGGGGDRKKKIEFRILMWKVESNFCCTWVGREKQHDSAVG